METEVLSVTEFHALLNQTLSFAYPAVVIEGEVASFKINQGKWIFFDLKDAESTISCFMTKYQLQTALEDGMLVRVVASPNLTKWGKFSLTVKSVELSGEGAVKRAFELLRAQFEKEGLFATERKRALPEYPERVALVSSAQAAAYHDFAKIIDERWSGLRVNLAQVQVQGADAPIQICRAIEYFNDHAPDYDVLVVIRGGGSAEDLQAFNSEDVVRAVYGAKIPTIVGIGHENDISLAELAADVRAATPTDAARRLVPDKHDMTRRITQVQERHATMLSTLIAKNLQRIDSLNHTFLQLYHGLSQRVESANVRMHAALNTQLLEYKRRLQTQSQLLRSLDPSAILARGYAIATIHHRVVHDPELVGPNDDVMLQLHQGKLAVRRTDAVGRRVAQLERKAKPKEQTDDQTRLKL